MTDFGLSKRIKEVSEQEESDSLDMVPYIDPIKFIGGVLNKMSDVYSIGVLLWEISSGQLPFKGESYNAALITRILQGYRETIVSDTPIDYFNLYTGKYNFLDFILILFNFNVLFIYTFFFRVLGW